MSLAATLKTTKGKWQVGNIVALVFALAANFLVGAQVLNLPAIGEISDKYASVLTPADYAFSIWSLIYILLIVFVAYQARDIFSPRNHNDLPQKIGPWFIVASICNGLWTYLFVSEWVGVSVLVLMMLAVALYILLWRLKIAVYDAPLSSIACVWWPLLIYTGWVTVAAVVNIASWIESLGVTVTPMVAHVALVVLTVGLLALLIMRNLRELLLASAWGIAAIGARQMQLSTDPSVSITAFTVTGIILVAVALHAYANRKSNVLGYIF